MFAYYLTLALWLALLLTLLVLGKSLRHRLYTRDYKSPVVAPIALQHWPILRSNPANSHSIEICEVGFTKDSKGSLMQLNMNQSEISIYWHLQ